MILSRIANDRGDALPEKLTMKTLKKYAADWKIWEFGLLIGCNNTVVYSFAFFLPLILKGALGYSLEKTYVLLFPPAVLGAMVSVSGAMAGHMTNTECSGCCSRPGSVTNTRLEDPSSS